MAALTFSFITALVAVASAAPPSTLVREAEPYDSNPQYNFNYQIQDPLTGDYKSQYEQRDGDNVQGSYTLVDADGFKRIVDYTADAVNGFNAVVRKEGGVDMKQATVAPVYVAPKAASNYYSGAVPRYTSSVPVATYASPYVTKYSQAPVSVAQGPAVYTASFSSPYVTYHI